MYFDHVEMVDPVLLNLALFLPNDFKELEQAIIFVSFVEVKLHCIVIRFCCVKVNTGKSIFAQPRILASRKVYKI